jgi:hypothetical protein
VQTTQQQAQESAPQQQFTATGQKTIPAVASTGQVVFSYDHPVPFIPGVDFPKSTEVYTDDGKKFVTTQDSGNVGPNSQSPPVPIVAEQSGAAGNVDAGAIRNITNNSEPNRFHVTNPEKTNGGVDASQKTIVSQQDLDKAKSQLGDPLVQKVKDELKQKAGKDKYIQETEKIDVTPTYDHKVNDEYASCPCQFNGSVQVTGKVTTIDDQKVKDVLMKALQKQVPKDYQLTNDTPAITYKLASHDDQGGLSFTASAAGFMATAIDVSGLQKALAGKSPKDAQTYVRTHVDQVDVRIHLSPSFMPWLPWIGGRIDIKRQVENTHPA